MTIYTSQRIEKVELITDTSKVTEYKVNTQTLTVHSVTSNRQAAIQRKGSIYIITK